MNGTDEKITIDRSEAFYRTAQAISLYIDQLSLPDDQNNMLVDLVTLHSTAAERSGFEFGIRLGVEIDRGLVKGFGVNT